MDNNSVKKIKPSKAYENSLEKNEQEVLVLPPNLLQELGINLGNIPNTSDYAIVKGNVEPSELQSGEKSKINSEELDNVDEEVSGHICEKSVKLSVPILSPINIPQQKEEHINENIVAYPSNIEQNNINININRNGTEIDGNTDIEIQSSVESNSDKKYQKKSNVFNNNTKNVEIGECNSLSQNSSHVNSSNDKKSKINIISQEVLNHGSAETLKKFKVNPTPKNALIPLKINTPIGKVLKSSSSFITSATSENSISLEPEFRSNKILETNESSCTMHSEEDDMNTNNFNNYSDVDAVDGLTSDTNKDLVSSDVKNANLNDKEATEEIEVYCVIDDEMHNLSEESNLPNENKTVDMDISDATPTPSTSLVSPISVSNTLTDSHQIKLKEVDKDVEIYTEKNNNITENFDESNISASDKQSMDESRHNSVTEKPFYLNQCLLEKVNLSPDHLTTKSKLCIQGVEKPGGIIEHIRLQTEKITLRTYKNGKTKSRFKNKTHDVILVSEMIAKTYDSTDVCTNMNSTNVTCVTKQMCTCNDFGKLQFDDDENECGHVHFLPKNTVNMKPTICENFSGDASNEDILFETDDNYENNDGQFNDLSNICYTDFSISESDVSEQFSENEKSLLSETCVNIFDESMNISNFDSTDDIKCHDINSFSTPEVKVVNIFAGNKLLGQKRKRIFNQEEEGIFPQGTDANYHNAPNAKKFISYVKCAVCGKEIAEIDWDSHLSDIHCHIAWKQGSNMIDLDDKKLIQKLSTTLKKRNNLCCTFCNHKERDSKKFLAHLKICITKIFTNVNISDSNFSDDINIENNDTIKCEICRENVPIAHWTEHMTIRHVGSKAQIEISPHPIENIIKTEPVDEEDVKLELVKCAVCKMEMNSIDWSDHNQKEHNYFAWKEGDPKLNLDDGRKIYNYLRQILKNIGSLVCSKCGFVYHYPKSYMKHIKTCNGDTVNNSHNDSVVSNQSNDDVNRTQNEGADTSLSFNGSVECGVCSQEVAGTEWLDHIHKEHNYLAKIRGVPPLDLENVEMVRKHLYRIRLITKYLSCAKCGTKRKMVKKFLEHIKECNGTTNTMNESTNNVESELDNSKDVSIWDKITLEYSGTVKCGVCLDEVEGKQWLQHIQKEHNYIAWIEGAQSLNFQMEEETSQYLNNVAKQTGVLICGKCGLNRKYGKAFMQHVKECDGSKAALVDQLNDSEIIKNNINSTYLDDCTNSSGQVKCGVCGVEVEGELWLQHIQKEHNYIAWVEGRPPINREDKELINTYLKLLIRRIGVLVCGKCGLPRKLAGSYLKHVSKCDENKEEAESSIQEDADEQENEFIHTKPVQCGVCLQQVEGSQWINHIRLKHEYLARIAGKPPLDVNDEEKVRKHLIAMRKHVEQLVCNNCGESRRHVGAFLRHVQYCDDAEKSDNGSVEMENEVTFAPSGRVRCGVCKQEILDDEQEIQTHLNNIRRYVRELVCNKCGETRKGVKSYLKHIKNCDGNERLSTETVEESQRDSVASVPTEEEKEFQLEFPGTVVCGVCEKEVYGNQWVHHIRMEHNYIAHVKGKTPLDTKNMKQIRAHLTAVSKYAGGLYCNKCGLMRLYVKSYLVHVKRCGNSGNPLPVDTNDPEIKKEPDESFNSDDTTKVTDKFLNNTNASQFVYEGIAKCGVCHIDVKRQDWIEHIQKEHNYLAWIDGQTPLDLKDEEQVHAHLYELTTLQNGLTCKTCDTKRKYVKSFLDHIRNCNVAMSDIREGTLVECAVCSEKLPVEGWKNHAMKKHYNIAWTVGSDPIDLKNPYAVEKYLKEYKKSQKYLICKICKLTRVSCAGFYAHILTCGKTDEEIEDFKSVCEICNSKYLCIYKNQHLAFHREQEYVKEKKSRALELAQTKADEGNTSGRRRAAEKAKTVIEDYKSSLSKLKHKCPSCSFGTDVEEELEGHRCEASSDKLSDSDASASDHSEDTDSDVDSNVSREEEEQAIDKKKRVETPAKVSHHIPFKVNSASNYVSQAALDFYNMHYTLDELFPKWKPTEYQEVGAKDLPKYMPTVEESCKVKIGNGEWSTYKRFEAKNDIVLGIFVGGSIRCVSWAAARCGGEAAESSYLAVAGHGAPAAPRLPASHLLQHPALLQLWDFGDFDSVPKFVLGLALDYGTVWAMDWCPSGARDLSAVQHGARARGEQKGHTVILVGYADGSTAFYDLNCDSPLLKSVENNVTVIYPFQDDRPHNTCISDVDLFACGDTGGGGGAWGAWGGASCTGVHAALRAGAPRLHAPLATSTALFTPNWPSLLVTADEAIANYMTNELEWHGSGRRLGGQRALATCERCGAAAALTPPALRLMRTHPAYRDPRRDVVGILRMAPLGKKRSKHTNDELSMKVEPLTYEDAVKEYGIELKLKIHMNKADQQVVVSEAKAQFPERFPLAEVPALAFCTAPSAHRQLALPTHSGLLFIVTM
ncbi:General transcription factor 3C polypeptide 2 [Papilio xuthus]|uniref:General transcription factor 3C polypeptide 2 n=1 Tax=Papilio xuthus TaxID=66420 RepID=A0A194PKD9_PAPXU|nr:General transcription factor 3C polypeptide 2 [Papilio xuthus]